MLGDLNQPPQQQAGKASRGQRQFPAAAPWLCDHIGMHPPPHVAEDKRSPHAQHASYGMATARLHRGVMHLPV